MAAKKNITVLLVMLLSIPVATTATFFSSFAGDHPKLNHWAKVLADSKAGTARRLEAAKRLGEAKDPNHLEILTRTLKDDQKAVRWAAVEALWDLGDKKAVPYLIEYLEKAETYQWGKILTMNALGSLRDPRAVDSLLSKLDSRNPFLRRSAALALVQIGDKRAIPGIIGLLRNKEGWLKRLAHRLLVELTKGEISREPPRGYEAWLKWYQGRGQRLRIKESGS